MALSPSSLNHLLTLLSPEMMETSLDVLTARLSQTFARNEFFKVGLALVQMLKERESLLPIPAQRVAALFYLHEMFKGEAFHLNPFAAVFMFFLHQPERRNGQEDDEQGGLSLVERQFITQLVTGAAKEWMKKSPKQICLSEPLAKLPAVDLTGIELTLVEQQSMMPQSSRSGVSPVIADPSSSLLTTQSSPESLTEVFESLLLGSEPPMTLSCSPEAVRPVPPLFFDEEELLWLNPPASDKTDVDLVLNDSMSKEKATVNEAKKLMNLACKGALSLSQQQQLKVMLEEDDSLVHQTGLVPSQLPDLVENNPLIAIEALMNILTSDVKATPEYLTMLVNMEMSLHSMEVVNRLTTAIELPFEFTNLYVSNCIHTCESMKDKYMQNRFARLLCVFLQSLIRNKIIDVQLLFIELQAFCIQFSRIREAAALFRLLKQLESGDVPSNNDIVPPSVNNLTMAPGSFQVSPSQLTASHSKSTNASGQSSKAK